jgi:hypothetical protein
LGSQGGNVRLLDTLWNNQCKSSSGSISPGSPRGRDQSINPLNRLREIESGGTYQGGHCDEQQHAVVSVTCANVCR